VLAPPFFILSLLLLSFFSLCLLCSSGHANINEPCSPIKSTWLGGARLASQRDLFKNVLVTRQEYQEYGQAWVARQFASRRVMSP